jgi:hypothetical protein
MSQRNEVVTETVSFVGWQVKPVGHVENVVGRNFLNT